MATRPKDTHMSAMVEPLEAFGLTVGFAADHAVVGVRGEVDILTAPELDAVLTAVIDRGHLPVVLDLAATTFMGVAGLRVIEAATHRLWRLRSGLHLRSPSAQVLRLLDITGMATTVHVAHGDDLDCGQAEEAEGAEDVRVRHVLETSSS